MTHEWYYSISVCIYLRCARNSMQFADNHLRLNAKLKILGVPYAFTPLIMELEKSEPSTFRTHARTLFELISYGV